MKLFKSLTLFLFFIQLKVMCYADSEAQVLNVYTLESFSEDKDMTLEECRVTSVETCLGLSYKTPEGKLATDLFSKHLDRYIITPNIKVKNKKTGGSQSSIAQDAKDDYRNDIKNIGKVVSVHTRISKLPNGKWFFFMGGSFVNVSTSSEISAGDESAKISIPKKCEKGSGDNITLKQDCLEKVLDKLSASLAASLAIRMNLADPNLTGVNIDHSKIGEPPLDMYDNEVSQYIEDKRIGKAEVPSLDDFTDVYVDRRNATGI